MREREREREKRGIRGTAKCGGSDSYAVHNFVSTVVITGCFIYMLYLVASNAFKCLCFLLQYLHYSSIGKRHGS